ncbi:AAA family ATPase [Nocardia bhagyanarayanae]|uniref:AAA domain-containing protein n=2 Tax=Nocardia TaxID=1817 RepID=A0A285LBR7_9NOCA|nr:AAA family ATPase [Nocardia bhagyanarayanae]MCP2275261.1 AAA domain-containing protein [Nocardia amikacinitolerans]MCP2290911.1 AAA domain-containing protein [Nocardia amikacinitolerans]MCP2296003.1 AAA domain-containing protein [Nocardia amikacinitolerans]MCP2316555.1 AAA domain-containing protein [Nocardia amikacinitolerans]TQM30464.1 AAA domain-containing protein [Nocardia bhagyanarayanae]
MYLVGGQRRDSLKLAISGTYGVGKSTTTETLSIATGIPRTHALTSRELLIDLAPGKTVMELNSIELLQLGLRRFEERVHNESGGGSFISDGSVVHEWVYGTARMAVGINPGAGLLLRTVKAAAGIGRKAPLREYTDIIGDVVKERAARLYDAYVHLPVEFPMKTDGHRPVSEPFRKLSDDTLLQVVKDIGLPYEVVGGTVHERVSRIIELFDLETVMPVDEAIAEAKRRVSAATEVLEEDDRFKEAQRKKSLWRKVSYAMRY